MKKSKHQHSRSKIWRKWLIVFGVIAIGLASLIWILDRFVFLPVKNPDFGVSFSAKRSAELSLNWQENYLALLDDLKFKNLRLMSYWDVHEAERGHFNFNDLDWQMDQAAKRNVKVSLSIGARQPRWPECHEPGWAHLLGGHSWKQTLYAYMEIVVERYKNHPALDSWQLENEGMNNWFGTCRQPDRERLIEEFTLMKNWDSHHPIYMSLSDQHGLPLGQPTPDAYGFSVYRKLWNEKVWPKGYIIYPTPLWYHRARAAVIKLVKQREVFIHELQLEPWGPEDTKNLSTAEQDKSMDVNQIGKNIDFARRIGKPKIDLWGSEWWYWRKQHNNDDKIWEEVRRQLNKS